MHQPLFFPFAIETDRLHTELFLYNPFTRLSRAISMSLRDGEPFMGYSVEIRDHEGTAVAALPSRRLRPLGIDRLMLSGVVPVPFVGTICVHCELDDELFMPSARRYVQMRVNVYCEGECVITDHGRQGAAADPEVIWGEATLDAAFDTAFFVMHTGQRTGSAGSSLVLQSYPGSNAARFAFPALQAGGSYVAFLSDLVPPDKVIESAVATVTEPEGGRLIGYHFKIPRAVRPAVPAGCRCD
jgi:hypothetical protein